MPAVFDYPSEVLKRINSFRDQGLTIYSVTRCKNGVWEIGTQRPSPVSYTYVSEG